ncbi:hypothetical protein ABZ901_24300 [Actinacidiphila alni]|uniref:hypothetical protein n=1 Tax=Actinacidiphila alni TaxID=380248 RepID=UPI0033E70E65
MQWTALVSAVVGAVIATASAAFLERDRWHRERQERVVAVRRDLYGEYLACLAQARNAFRGIARDQEMDRVTRERSARESFAPCYGMRYQMSIMAPQEILTASDDTFRRLRDVRDLTAQGASARDEAYSNERAEYEKALTRLRTAMRTDLGAD